VSLKKVKKHVVKQYNSKWPLCTNKIWLIKRRKQGLKSPTFRTQNGFPNCSVINKIYVKKPNKNAHKRIRMSLKSLKYLEHEEANHFHHQASIHRLLFRLKFNRKTRLKKLETFKRKKTV
jgi:hypothetical protein